MHSSKSTHKNLAIIIPAYNEEECIPQVIKEWSEVAAKCNGDCIFLNDGSKDSTLEILLQSQKVYDNVIIIDKDNSGHGQTCLRGYEFAIENNYEWIFQTDSDGQTLPSEFLRVWDMKNEGEFHFGFRRTRGDGLGRYIISRVLRIAILLTTGVYVTDSNVPFRLMKAKELSPLIKETPEDMFLVNSFLATKITKHAHIKWTPITFKPRQGGVPSVSWKRFFSLGLKIIKEFWNSRRLI